MGRADMGRAHMGQGPYGPGPRAPGPGPGTPGPGPRPDSETLTENPTWKKRRNSVFFDLFMETKKNRSAITINLPAVSRRHLLYEVQSCKKSYPPKVTICACNPQFRSSCNPQFRSSPYPHFKGTLSYILHSYIIYIRTHVDCYPALGAGDYCHKKFRPCFARLKN